MATKSPWFDIIESFADEDLGEKIFSWCEKIQSHFGVNVLPAKILREDLLPSNVPGPYFILSDTDNDTLLDLEEENREEDFVRFLRNTQKFFEDGSALLAGLVDIYYDLAHSEYYFDER